MQITDNTCATCTQLREALESRTATATAIGLLMERETLDPLAAFEMLRVASQQTNRKLREIANDLVAAASANALDGGPAVYPLAKEPRNLTVKVD
jgi:AmiR/NasT family two-component response regulator